MGVWTIKLYGIDGKRLRLPKSFYDRPLTQKEADFARDNIDVVWYYLHKNGLDSSEWFDVVIFRYLMTVKRWFALPEIRQVKFITLACSAMRSAVDNELNKQATQPQVLSLYDTIPGTEDLRYIDTIPAVDSFNEE